MPTSSQNLKIFLFSLSVLIFVWCDVSVAGGFRYSADRTVVGSFKNHTVKPKETLLDIARKFGLGFNEVEILYPDMDYWIPTPGRRLVMPTQWILPSTRYYGLVINLPELRLYHFFPKYGMVTTYPIGIGVSGWETPIASGRIIHRQVDPTWVVPKTLRKKYGAVSIPPGKNNPLGKYWIGLSLDGYGIHGTNFPWGVGRLVSHGCIRLYPEHIALLYKEVYVNTPFEIIYEPLKIGIKDHSIFMEVHPDVYQKIPDLFAYAKKRLKDLGFWNSVSTETVKEIVKNQNGIPVFLGYMRKGGDDPIVMGASGF
jgi:L,D-transpeptidase ErfK/SrfK